MFNPKFHLKIIQDQPFLAVQATLFPEFGRNVAPKWNPIYRKGNALPFFKTLELCQVSLNETLLGTIIPGDDQVEQDGVAKEDIKNFGYMDRTFTNVTEDGGIKKMLIRPGKGIAMIKGQRIKIHYEAFLFDEAHNLMAEPFDSSQRRKEKWSNGKTTGPVVYSYTLLTGQVIPVLDIGVATMEIGEKAEFLATGRYAYGSFGICDVVPSYANIFFKVEVVKATNNSMKKPRRKSTMPDHLIS